MSGNHINGKNHNFEKTYPGCLGRMVNLFELNLGVSANKLLTDKPHRDGSPLSRSRSDVSRISPSREQIEDEVTVSVFNKTSSNRKSSGTPMKMLIAQEMIKDVDSTRSSPNLVAKLMGLDALPLQEPGSAMQRSHFKDRSRSHSDIPLSYWEQQNGFFHSVEPNEYRDVHEIRQQSQKSPHKGRYEETTNNKKMDLVRQKFDEAKRMSMNVKLRQSKQFQDALEVLNSNKDLFIKCLQEPNKMFSEHLYNLRSVPPPSEAKRITVLRPSKMSDSANCAGAGIKDEKQMKRSASVQLNRMEKSHLECFPPSNWKDYENPTQPTRIVVLKPNPRKPQDLKDVGLPQSESPRILQSEDFFADVEDENQESREVAKAITRQMREKLGRHGRDETLISSVFSNGYAGDESSFNKSEIDYEVANLSDSEVTSPVSMHSWDYVNRLGSPYSPSFSRASYSPESSVCREAKKRLSERWSMIATNGSCQEQKPVRRSSSTLGEMLALSEAKKAAVSAEQGISTEESKDPNSALVGEQRTDEITDNSPKNLLRSKSVPVFSIEFGSRLNVDMSLLDNGKPEMPKEDAKDKNAKSSFKGKVSSWFFLKNKKPNEDNSLASDANDESSSGQTSNNGPESVGVKGPNHLSLGLMKPSSKTSSSNLIGDHVMTFLETGLSMSKPVASGNLGENRDQPSPISVLDIPFEEDMHTSKLLPRYVKPQGVESSLNPLRSNLIDKSPPIGSIARTLPLDDSCVDTASSYSIKESLATQGKEEEQQELFFFVKTLLSAAGLQGNVRSNSIFTTWHSPESPLDLSLRDNYIDLKDKETLQEAKRRQKRSIRKLVFDCVNSALMEISGDGPDLCQTPKTGPSDNASSTILDKVWARMNVGVSGESRRGLYDYGDDSLVVEMVVRNEVVGNGWIDQLRSETNNFGMQIEGELLEELVHETVSELTGRM